MYSRRNKKKGQHFPPYFDASIFVNSLAISVQRDYRLVIHFRDAGI